MQASPNDTSIVATRDGGVLRLHIARPERGNTLTYPMLAALTAHARAAAEDWDVRAVVIQGDGDDFCTGDDPEDMGTWPEGMGHRRPGGEHGAPPLPEQELLRTLRSRPKPVIAVIRGRALGLGLDLACACDIRLCAEDAVFADPRVGQARHAATGITHVLPRLIGQSQAMRLLLLGDQIDGREAARIGLAYRAVPAQELNTEAEKLVAEVAAMATRSYAIIKQQILDELDMPYDAALMHSLAIRQTNVIEDRAEGQRAFAEKRPPRYTGR